jgi:glycosyltransferase involved in cell wall biosynthesis
LSVEFRNATRESTDVAEAAHANALVLLLTQHSLEEHGVVNRNVIDLLRRGFDVDAVCTAGLEQPALLDGLPGRLRTFAIRIPHRRGAALRYLLEYGAFFAAAVAVTSKLALRHRYELVQVDNLPDLLVFAPFLARQRGARVVFNMFELTPEMVDAGRPGRAGGVLARFARRVEAAAIRWADRVIVVSRPCHDALVGRGAPGEKLAIVVNTTTLARTHLAESEAERPDGGYLVTHGTLVLRNGTHLLLYALDLLKHARPGLRLRVIGTGEQLPALRSLAAEIGLADRVVFTGHLPWDRALAEVRGAALGIVAVLPDAYAELMLPTNLLEYAQLGVPAICPWLPAIDAYFPADTVAYFRPGDAWALAATIDRLLSDPDAAHAQAARARDAVAGLCWERMRERYIEALGLPAPELAGARPEPTRGSA